jgi:hypothetical protein
MNEATLDGMASPPMGYSDDENEEGASPRPPGALGPRGADPVAAVAAAAEALLRQSGGAVLGRALEGGLCLGATPCLQAVARSTRFPARQECWKVWARR